MKSTSAIHLDRIRRHKLTRFSPIRGLTPEVLARKLDSFAAGDLRPFALLAEAIRNRDDVISTVAPKREGAPSRRTWEVLTVATPDNPLEMETAERHKEVLEYFWNNVGATSALERNLTGGFSLLTRQMLRAIGDKYSVHEILWRQTARGLTATFHHVPLWFFENRTGALRYLREDTATDGVDLEPDGWLVTVGQGIMEASAVAYMFKHLPLRDWLLYSEKHGFPGIQGKTAAKKNSAEWNAMVEAVADIAADFSCVTSLTDTIEKLDFSASGELPFPGLVERMDRAIAALWRGADLSTMSSGKGEGLGASLQGDEGHLLECDDAQLVSETLNRVDEMVIRHTFGEGVAPLAYVKIIVPPHKNVDQELKVSRQLWEMGAPIAVTDELERFSRPVPDEGERLLPPYQAPGPAIPPVAGTTRPGGAPLSLFLANEALEPSRELTGAVAAAVADIRAEWLAPLFTLFKGLEGALNNERLTDAEVLQFVEQMAQSVPGLFDKLNHAALANTMEAALGSAVVEALEEIESARGRDGEAANARRITHHAPRTTEAANELEPLADAVATISSKTPVGSILRTRDWAQMPAALRARAQFSAGVESARLLQAIQDKLMDAITLARGEAKGAERIAAGEPGAFKMDRKTFIADLRAIAREEGLEPDASLRGGLQDITSERRLGLIFDTQMQQAKGHAYWKRGQEPAILNEWPAQELVRVRNSRVPRDWRARWVENGGRIVDGRMVALKTDPVWTAISRFGQPWPPFDFNSGMGVEEVDRDEAEDLGLITASEQLQPTVEDFNAQLEASARGLDERLLVALTNLFGTQLELDGDVLKWRARA